MSKIKWKMNDALQSEERKSANRSWRIMSDQRFRCGKELAIVKYRFKESILHFFSRWYLQFHTIKWRILSKFNKNNTHINENDRIRLKHQNICKTKKRNLIWQILFLMLGFIHSVGFHASLNTRQTVLRDRFFTALYFVFISQSSTFSIMIPVT